MSDSRNYKDTVFLPKTDFPMKAGLPQKEPGILARWQEADLYSQVRAARAGREQFILHDGPPYANGDMHIGHALNHVLKDMVVRTQTLLGKDAPYVPGWDCHGLPIEWKVEEQYRKKKLNKDEVDPVEFRAECRAYAAHWVDVQRDQLKRLGGLGEWDNPYLTMHSDAEGTIVAELMKFAESGQLYRGAKPVMWSPVEKTALAEAEVEYEDITSTQIDVAFEIMDSPIEELKGAYAVIWTTTPWTIPVNQALAYGADVEYELVEFWASHDGPNETDYLNNPDLKYLGNRSGHSPKFLISSILKSEIADRLSKLAEQACPGIGLTIGAVPVDGINPILGNHLAGTVARHPMHKLGGFYAEPRPFLDGSAFVTTESGTGLVHMAPDHGEDDFDLCKANGINPVFAVDAGGVYRDDWLWLGAHDDRRRAVINNNFNAPEGPICSDLKEAGALLAASADLKHSYPHSWRSKAKIIYRCTPQWFVAMDKVLDGQVPLCAAEEAIRSEQGEGQTLRETAVKAIADTRFIPEKGRNRIGSMVEGRPDWVLSRQRAWGVPITLFVNRESGEYLVDPAVNARIIAAIREGGVDAWSDESAQALLGNDYNVADYERVGDILDVWFDSGCTHAFVLGSGKWPDLTRPDDYAGPPADLYLEGSDQHRGWFQSSLLESCGTRGRAPYKAVLTHGFTMDSKGMKMSKSAGNTVSPNDVMRDYGADIIRLWALSVDYTEDHRIGPEILKGVADQYRKLRNTFRYLLGALEGFSEEERLPVDQMPELERYVLALLAELDGKLRKAVEDYDFNTYTRVLSDFCNEDLSAFYFDIRKDSLYCDAAGSVKRRAARTVFDIMFHALVRYGAPVLVFTAEEVWSTRFPDKGSVHLLEWPEVQLAEETPANTAKWAALRNLRENVMEAIEPLRREKTVRSGLEAEVTVPADAVPEGFNDEDLTELFISGPVSRGTSDIAVAKTGNAKCGRCWRLLPEVSEDGALCGRCEDVIAELDAAA